MRIHHLRVTAIGPFPGHHEVDLDELSAGGLFLLEGPTGAGKSTLIDAITYGLYGTLGSKALDSRLPSAHAPQTEPVIEVVFSTAAGIFRVVRTPPYERPKKRGTGVTPQHATAKLWRLSAVEDTTGEAIAASTQEVGTEVGHILGLNRLQFSQTVVLPQGRFATFLHAKPEDRADVLRDVFGTVVYQQLQEELANQARAAKRRIETTQQKVATAVATFVGLLAEDDPAATALSEAVAELDTARLISVSQDVLTARQAVETAATATQQEAATAERAAQRAWDTERDLDRALTRRRHLLSQQEALTQAEPRIAEDREQLAAARRAAVVAGPLRSYRTAVAGVAAAERSLATAAASVADTPDADLAEITALPQLRQAVDDLAGRLGALTEPLRVAATLTERDAQLDRDEAALGLDRAAIATQAESLEHRPEHRAALVAALDERRAGATPVATAQAAVDRWRTVHEAARQAEEHADELATAETLVAEAQLAATTAWAHEQAVRGRWINSMAINLAAELEPGHPCPVCGSADHPAPAGEGPDRAGLEDVEAATTARQEADTRLAEAHTAKIRATERLTAQQKTAGHTTVADAAAELAAAEQAVTAAAETVRLIEQEEAAIAAFEAETTSLRDRQAAAEQEVATTAERLRGLREQLAQDHDRCRQAADGAATVAERVAQLEARRAAADRLREARQACQEAEQRRDESATALDEALAEADFPDADAATAAQLGAAELDAVEQRLTAHDTALAQVRDGLAEEAVAALTGAEVADVAAAEHRHAAAREALQAATSAAATATAGVSACERHRGPLLELLDAHGHTTREAAPVLRMGDLATGGEGNSRATTLATYVLLRRFEDVVATANDRLSVMSGGRFSLVRIDGKEGRARRAGLGLAVRDHHTETDRDPHTLSGGETFYVSLCLALGLADVVTSEAGGITLDTLFIDEGFGSLDPHTLDGVLGELTRLQAGGRAVGIVSHVAELKDRVAERIEVSRLPAGGSTLTVRA